MSQHDETTPIQTFLDEHLPADWAGIGAIADRDEADAFVESWRATLAANGLLGVSWPKAYGGAGLSKFEQVVLVEELARLCGAEPVRLTPVEHDRAVARTSHLPHLLAVLTAGQLAEAQPEHLSLSGQGVRDVTRIAAGDPDAAVALNVYCHRVRKYVGAYLAVLGGADVIAFTAGVGENDAVVRARILEGLDTVGISVDPDRNAVRSADARVISPDGSPVTVMVVPTNEELAIARATVAVVG